jgi:hypothetical protein
MIEPGSAQELFRGRHFDREIIVLCVRWYLTFKLSSRDLVQMMAERGIVLAHTTILRWVQRYVPDFEKRWQAYARPVGDSWRVDETYLKIKGQTPQALQAAGKRQWEKFLHARRLWRAESAPRRLELFAQATDFGSSEPTTRAKSQLALSLVHLLLAIEKQLGQYRKRIEELFGPHPDHGLFGSLPGAGPKLAPRLTAEIGDNRQRFDGDAQANAWPARLR